MNKIIYYFLICFFLETSASLKKVQTSEFSLICETLKKKNSRTLIIIDIWNVFFNYENELFNLQNQKLFRHYAKKYEKNLKQILEKEKIRCVLENIKIFSLLDSKGMVILGLGSKITEYNKIKILSFDKICNFQRSSINVAFKKNDVLRNLHKGIIFSVIKDFLEFLSEIMLEYDEIIFITSSNINVKEFEEFAKKNAKNFIIFEYTGEKNKIAMPKEEVKKALKGL